VKVTVHDVDTPVELEPFSHVETSEPGASGLIVNSIWPVKPALAVGSVTVTMQLIGSSTVAPVDGQLTVVVVESTATSDVEPSLLACSVSARAGIYVALIV
jgi:hypothetical protein